MYRPSKKEVAAAKDKVIADVIGPGLRVLFCGINPGLYSAAIGHHFGRPGNRFWPALYRAGFTPRLFTAFEDGELLRYGYGITNLVERASAVAGELKSEEFVEGARRLERKVRKFRPAYVAVVGITAFRQAYRCPKARLGPQEKRIGDTGVWVLPNPSGLNAHYQLEDFARMFRELREVVE